MALTLTLEALGPDQGWTDITEHWRLDVPTHIAWGRQAQDGPVLGQSANFALDLDERPERVRLTASDGTTTEILYEGPLT